jgi:hypothetical protein
MRLAHRFTRFASAIAVAAVVSVIGTQVASAAPNASVLFVYGAGKVETGLLQGGLYTRKHRFSLAGVTAAAATRTSLALYTKSTGKLRTGKFVAGTWTLVETITVRPGFTHAIASCDSLLLYNDLTGRAMTGTLIGGRFRNRTSFFLPNTFSSLASGCDTTIFVGPQTMPGTAKIGLIGTLSGGDWSKTGELTDTSTNGRVGMAGSSYLRWHEPYADSGGATGGSLTSAVFVTNFDPWDIITGSADSFIYYRSTGFACTQQYVGVVSGAATCATGAVPAGARIITGGR